MTESNQHLKLLQQYLGFLVYNVHRYQSVPVIWLGQGEALGLEMVLGENDQSCDLIKLIRVWNSCDREQGLIVVLMECWGLCWILV